MDNFRSSRRCVAPRIRKSRSPFPSVTHQIIISEIIEMVKRSQVQKCLILHILNRIYGVVVDFTIYRVILKFYVICLEFFIDLELHKRR